MAEDSPSAEVIPTAAQVPAELPAHAASPIATTATEAEQPGQPYRRKPARASRSKFRSEILRTSAEDLALQDPFGNELEGMQDTELPPATPPEEPAARPPIRFDDGGQMELPPGESTYLNEPDSLSPPRSTEPFATAEPPLEGECASDKEAIKECGDALRILRERTLNTLSINVELTGEEGRDFPCECER